MSKFSYVRATSIPEALRLKAGHPGCHYVAGGTDLLPKIKFGRVEPLALIDVSKLDALHGVRLENDRLTLGAAVTHTQIAESTLIKRHSPVLAKAAGLIGSPQIRNRGTVGGNIGNASPAADLVTALIALGARISIASLEGVRRLDLEELFTGPGATILDPGGLITEVTIPVGHEGQGGAFHKLGKRRALSVAVVNAAAWVDIESGTNTIRKARLALGAVASTVIRAKESEAQLIGRKMSQAAIRQACETAIRSLKPIDDLRADATYRRQVAPILLRRALEDAWATATGECQWKV